MVVNNKISACLVVYNEEKLIERCLKSICDFVDEIIIVHDGECADQTLEIAKKYTDKIFIKEHIGIAEPHRSFTYEQAKNEWILQIDADEYLDSTKEVSAMINEMVKDPNFDGYWFKWEIWHKNEAYLIDGIKKLCLARKKQMYYFGLPQEGINIISKKTKDVGIILRHRPLYDNLLFKNSYNKLKKWIPIHARYFFPELVIYETFNVNIQQWIKKATKVKKNIIVYLIFAPFINAAGQIKNGLWKSRLGIICVFHQYINSVYLYWSIMKIMLRK